MYIENLDFELRLITWFYFQVPPGNNVDSEYRLRLEGSGIGGGAIIFENETKLEFSRQFLSISISTNKAVYDGFQDIRLVGECWKFYFLSVFRRFNIFMLKFSKIISRLTIKNHNFNNKENPLWVKFFYSSPPPRRSG